MIQGQSLVLLGLAQVLLFPLASSIPAKLLAITEDPYKGFYLRHHNGMCFTVDVHNDRIYLSWRCQDKFEWLTMSGYKYFRHIASQLCIGRVNNGPRSANWLILKHCKRSTATPYKFTDSPKNLKTTMGAPQCIHPNGGLWNPKDGTYLLTHPVCGEKRIAMNLSNGKADPYSKETVIHIRYNNNKCLHIHQNKLLFGDKCSDFVLDKNQYMRHIDSGHCVGPDPRNPHMSLSGKCNDYCKFQKLKNGFLKNVKTGKCVYPNGGSANPNGGQQAVIYSGCQRGLAKYRFTKVREFYVKFHRNAGYNEDMSRPLGTRLYQINRASDNKCVAVKAPKGHLPHLIIKSGKCEDLFMLDAKKDFTVAYTGKTISFNGDAVYLYKIRTVNTKFEYTSQGTLKQLRSGRCMATRNNRVVASSECRRRSFNHFLLKPKAALLKFTIYQKTNNLCWTINKNGFVILSKYCSGNFAFTTNGALLHVDSGKCVAYECSNHNCKLRVYSSCTENSRFKHLHSHMIKAKRYSLCIHPYGGLTNPSEGTVLVVHACHLKSSIQFGRKYDGYVESLLLKQAKAWAPRLYFEPNERYWPSSVDYFLRNVQVFPHHKQPSVLTPSNLPYLKESSYRKSLTHANRYYLKTKGWGNTEAFKKGENLHSHLPPTYVISTVHGRRVEMKYFTFYPYNEGKKHHIPLKGTHYWGSHYGDWEHISVTLKDGKPLAFYFEAHGFKMHFKANKGVLTPTGSYPTSDVKSKATWMGFSTRGEPKAFLARGSHGTYPQGRHYHYKNVNIEKKCKWVLVWFTPVKICSPKIRLSTLWDLCSSNGFQLATSAHFKVLRKRSGEHYQPYSGTENWRNFRGRWGNYKWGCAYGVCRNEHGPTGPY